MERLEADVCVVGAGFGGMAAAWHLHKAGGEVVVLEAEAVRDYHEQDWVAENWSQGAFCTHFPPGVLTSFGPALRRPVGPLHWAGTNYATHMTSCIDGAIRSGERAADEVIATIESAVPGAA
jgi:monoamine oxidase